MKHGNCDSLKVVVVGWREFLTGVEESLQSLVLILNAADDGERRRQRLNVYKI